MKKLDKKILMEFIKKNNERNQQTIFDFIEMSDGEEQIEIKKEEKNVVPNA